jgi:DDE superfamily endonuclease
MPQGRARLPGDRRHLNPHRPGRRGPAVLLRQAPQARDEPAGHRQPHGDIVWVSGALPGAVHDLTAARIWGIIAELAASGLVVLRDKGYLGEDDIRTPYRGRNKPASQKDANRAHARLRAPGERANAQLKSWRILRKLRCCLWRAGQLAKAIHVLQTREIGVRRKSSTRNTGNGVRRRERRVKAVVPQSIAHRRALAGFVTLAIMSSAEGHPDFCRAAWPGAWNPDASEVWGVVDLSASLGGQHMAGLSRRMLLRRGGAGAVAAGFVAVIPGFPGRAEASVKAATVHSDDVAAPAGPAAAGPLVVHIPDPRTGEVHLMVGDREVVRTDPALVARLVRDAG